MTVAIYVPRDSGALALGAEKVAKAIEKEILARGLDAKIVRNGSRGLYWLEPMVEVETPAGRVAYGPVKAKDVAPLFEAGLGLTTHSTHPLFLGDPEKIPYLAKQTRLTFARCGITDPVSLDDYEAHDGLKGLRKAVVMAPADIVKEVTELRPARPRRRRLPDRHQVEHGAGHDIRPEVHRLQRRRGR